MTGFRPVRALLAVLLLIVPGTAHGHGYEELSGLSPQLRGVLIDTLETAKAEGRFFALGDGLAASIDALGREDRAWLAGRVLTAAGAEPDRLPPNLVMTLFYDLADFALQYGEHRHGAADDDTAAEDFRRIRALVAG